MSVRFCAVIISNMRTNHEGYVREAFGQEDALLPEVPVCGRSDQRAARPGLEPHVHPDALEVCLLTRGEVDWWVEDRVFTVDAGDVFVTHPGERHGGVGSVVHPCELYWFQLATRPRLLDNWPGTDAAAIRRDIMCLPVRTFEASPFLVQSIRCLIDEHRHRQPHATSAARAALHAVVVSLIREAGEARAPEISLPVQHAMNWMSKRVEQPFGVDDVAAAVGLSTVRLQARFRRELNCSVGEHRNRLRVHRAKLLLRDTDQSITTIAHQMCFASSQYFATFFRQHVGMQPSAYREQIR